MGKSKTAPQIEEEGETEEEAAFKLSQLLKRSHDGRTAALFKDDNVSEHIQREAAHAASMRA